MHVSIANPSIDSPLPYYRGKALVEQALAASDVPYAVLRDVVLTADEICGLTAGLLVSHQPALGRVSFLEWLKENASTLGRAYANELDRHFRMRG